MNKLNTSHLYGGYPVNTNGEEEQRLDTDILEAQKLRFEEMTNRYSQCLLIRFDLHIPKDTPINPLEENKLVSRFFNELIHKCLKRGFGGREKHKYAAYFWVREINKAKNAHYHCWIMVDRHKIKFAGMYKDRSGLAGKIIEIWKRLSGGGHIQPPETNQGGLNVRQEYPDEANEAFYAISYLAKRRGKNYSKEKDERNWAGNTLGKIPPRKIKLAS
ncbi:inovirus-type Gp2 protein [Halopseudomonas sp.]|uniref:YagK/YfjJ domain-containing protein n=1 Tax=Halopseudomonas sp. TaxID=2901191 RepID=UPI00311ED00B